MKVGTDGVLLGAWADVSGAQSILDIGAGTGVIAIMLAQRSGANPIHAVEIDEEACVQAAENMAQSPWAERLEAKQVAVQHFAKLSRDKYDLIVSNPPFFTGGTFSESQDKLSVRHTVKLPHGDLLGAVRSLLSSRGKFCAILPNIEGLRFRELAKTYNLHCTKLTAVHPVVGKPVERLLLQFEREAKPLQKDALNIQQTGETNDWTEAYVALTQAFYEKI